MLVLLSVVEIHLLLCRHGQLRQRWLRLTEIRNRESQRRGVCHEGLQNIRFLDVLFFAIPVSGVLIFGSQAAWIIDEVDEEDSDNGDSDDDRMVLDRGEDQYSNQDQDFEDDKETLYVQDMDNETHNDSEMMVIKLFLHLRSDLQTVFVASLHFFCYD